MNLGDAKLDYRKVLEQLAHSAAPGDDSRDGGGLEAYRRLDAVRAKAMHDIDEYTTRRFLPVNTRRGLIAKLERLHSQAQAELRAITATRQRPGTSR